VDKDVAEPPRSEKAAAVVVEDDRYVLDFLKFTLVQLGLEVFGAEDGEAGWELIRRRKPALVLMDLMLPKLDGFGLLKRMAQEPATAAVPVVVVSAYTVGDSIRRLALAQPNVRDVFNKPLRGKELQNRLKEILAGRGPGA
jgi:two-component system, OmpR family, alkaline phosphatase synthesis response regulator PhoP